MTQNRSRSQFTIHKKNFDLPLFGSNIGYFCQYLAVYVPTLALFDHMCPDFTTYRKCRHECPWAVYQVIDKFRYVASDKF